MFHEEVPYFFNSARRSHDANLPWEKVFVYHDLRCMLRSFMLREVDIHFSPRGRSLSIMFREAELLVFSYPSKQIHAQPLSPWSFALEMLSLEVCYIPYEVATFPAKCITFFVKCVPNSSFSCDLNSSFIWLFDEVTPCASRWSIYLYIAPPDMLESLCFALVSLSLYNTF